MISIAKAVFPIDFREPSYEELTAANGLALPYSSEFRVVHVIAPIPYSLLYAIYDLMFACMRKHLLCLQEIHAKK